MNASKNGMIMMKPETTNNNMVSSPTEIPPLENENPQVEENLSEE
jgi:hypothetical protein